MNILIIEDDESVGELERDYLEMSGGFHCTLRSYRWMCPFTRATSSLGLKGFVM